MKRTFRVVLAATLALVSAAGTAEARSVYVSSNTQDELAVADIGTSGAVTPKTGSPLAVGDGPNAVVLTPDARFLYLAESDDDRIHRFSVASDGSLTSGPVTPTGQYPYGLTITADGRFLYAALDGSDQVAGFAIGPDGSLTPVPGTPGTFPAAASLQGITASVDGRTLYVPDYAADELYFFRVAADGSITSPAQAAVGANHEIYDTVVTPDGKFLYTGDGFADVLIGYSLAADGTPAQLPGPTTPAGDPYDGFVISPDGRHLFVTNFGVPAVETYAIGSDGSLTAAVGAMSGTQGTSAAITPDGRFLYSASFADPSPLNGFTVAADGDLGFVPGSSFDLGGGRADQAAVAITPNQPPVAAVTAGKAKKRKVTLDASGSTDADGTIASYAFDFGDGKTETTTTPTTTHKYAKTGDYTATVTVTDADGCSVDPIYTGRATLCNGSAVATAATEVDTGVEGAKVKARKTQRQKGDKVVVTVQVGAAEKVTAVARGSISLGGVKRELKSIKLKKAKKKVKARKTKTLKLKVKRTSATRKVLTAIDDGGTVSAKLVVTLKDSAGNKVTKKPKVRLR